MPVGAAYVPNLTRTSAALPESLAAGEFLTTTDGTAEGDGSLAAPWDLATGLTSIASGQTLLIGDGIYTVSDDILNFGIVGNAEQVTIKAVTNARPIIVHSEAQTVKPYLRDKTTVDGLWFGAAAKDAVDHTLTAGDDAILKNCTLWNFYQGVNVSHALRTQLLNNRFINCGTSHWWHDIYINEAASEGNGAVLRGNIHLGGEGLKTSTWHDPSYATIDNCFYNDEDTYEAVTIQGDNHTVTKNIIWGAGRMWFNRPTNSVLNENLYGANSEGFDGALGEGSVADANVFLGGVETGGTNPVEWDDATFKTTLGHGRCTVGLSVEHAKTAFAQSVANIWADAAIEPVFTVIEEILAAWDAA